MWEPVGVMTSKSLNYLSDHQIVARLTEGMCPFLDIVHASPSLFTYHVLPSVTTAKLHTHTSCTSYSYVAMTKYLREAVRVCSGWYKMAHSFIRHRPSWWGRQDGRKGSICGGGSIGLSCSPGVHQEAASAGAEPGGRSRPPPLISTAWFWLPATCCKDHCDDNDWSLQSHAGWNKKASDKAG